MERIGPPPIEQFARLRPLLGRVLVTAGFWGAVILGLATLPVLVLAPTRIDLLSVLVVGNVLCLLIGHRHEPTDNELLARWRDRGEVAG